MFKSKLLCLFVVILYFAGCSSDSNNESSIRLSAPNQLAVTAKHEELVVQFSKLAGIGSTGYEVNPVYYVSIMNNGGSITELGSFPTPDVHNLIKFTIKSKLTQEEETSKNVYFKYPLKDGVEYSVMVKACYDGYGCTDNASIKAKPIPLPTPIENAKVESGDKRLVVSWKEKPYESYSVHMDDCPTKPMQYDKWTLNTVTGNNKVFSLEDNTKTHKICIISHNENGRGKWYFFDNKEFQGQNASTAPKKPVITLKSENNKMLVFNLKTDLVGASSVSEYEYAYSKNNRDYSNWAKLNVAKINDDFSVIGLENNVTYYVKVRAKNSQNTNGIESDAVFGTPKKQAIDFNDKNIILGKATSVFAYAENIPHSDFWRISENRRKGGRPDTDRLVRGKETAVGNLYADGLKWYVDENIEKIDFAFLIGDMINSGIQAGQDITLGYLYGMTNQDYIDDTIVIAELKGSELINSYDYSIDLNGDYPALDKGNFGQSLFGQAAAVYHNGHYGGSGGTTYNGAYWGIPSYNVKYTIAYRDYSLDKFKENFDKNCSTVDKKTGIDSTTGKLYDAVKDPKKCYLLSYDDANPEQGSPSETAVMSYKRGKIKENTLFINGKPVDSNKIYKIATTKKIADSMYIAFLKGSYSDTGVSFIKAFAEYINYLGIVEPKLNGRIKLEGGVPGDKSKDFIEK